MTDDIVMRLKKDRDKDLFPILEEAAEEIERLRKLVNAQKGRTAEVSQLCKETTDELLSDRNRWRDLAEFLCQKAPGITVPDEIASRFPDPLVVTICDDPEAIWLRNE